MTIYAPIFGERNKINNVDHISDSAGTDDTTQRKMFDRNKEIQYSTIGETAGTSTITWTPATSQNVSLIAIQNCNWSDFTIKYDTSNDFSTPIAVVSGTYTNYLFVVDQQSCANVVITITGTITAGETRNAGQIYISDTLYTIPDDMAGNVNLPRPVQKSSIIPLADGTVNNVYVREILNWDMVLRLVTAAERANFISIFEYHRRNPFFFIPRPATPSDEWLGEGGHYIWANAPDYYRYSADWGGDGYDINIKMLQAGGV